MIQGVDQWQGRCAIEGASIVEGRRNAHTGLVDVWDAKVDFSHDEDEGYDDVALLAMLFLLRWSVLALPEIESCSYQVPEVLSQKSQLFEHTSN